MSGAPARLAEHQVAAHGVPAGGRAVRPRRGRRRRRSILWTIPYLLPAVALVVFVFGYPLLRLLDYSFATRPNAPNSSLTTKNFRLSVEDPNFYPAIKHNLTLLAAVPILTVLALLAAILIFENTRWSGFYRSALFLPYVLSIPVVGVAFGSIYARHGPLNDIFAAVGLDGLVRDWLGDPSFALYAVITVIVWKEFGFGLILFGARLTSVDQELYDAAKVDGAKWWARHRHVTIPDLWKVIEFFVIVETITMLAFVFGYVFTMTHGGPGGATVVMEFLIWSQGFAAANLGLAAATAVILLGGTLLLLFLQGLIRALVARRPA